MIKNTELADIDIETGKDLVDLKVAEKFRKRIRLCSDNHINCRTVGTLDKHELPAAGFLPFLWF